MSDLSDRLRMRAERVSECFADHGPLDLVSGRVREVLHEAADRLDALEAEVARLTEERDEVRQAAQAHWDERLKAERDAAEEIDTLAVLARQLTAALAHIEWPKAQCPYCGWKNDERRHAPLCGLAIALAAAKDAWIEVTP